MATQYKEGKQQELWKQQQTHLSPCFSSDHSTPLSETESKSWKTRRFCNDPLCCCVAKTWCKFIGWISVVVSLLSLSSGYFDLGRLPMREFQGVIPLLLGFILLAGVYTKTPELLKIWLIANGIVLSILLIAGAVLVFIFSNDPMVWYLILSLLIVVSIVCYFLHVVNKHRQELVRGKLVCNPIIQFSPFPPSGDTSQRTNDTFV